MNRIYLSPPNMGQYEQKYVQEVFDSNWIAPLGPQVDAFEREMCDYIGVNHAAALSSGTAALHLALRILGIKENDVVFCSSLTFAASASPILYEKAVPVFIDSDRETWNMCPIALERALSEYKKRNHLPKVVIVVNLYGQSADYDRILEICYCYHVPVIEDAAESLGASYKNRKSGNFGVMSVLSFNGNKIITTSGGGMLLSNNEDFIKKARFLATQARDNALHYEHSQLGFNYRLSNVLAAIGRGQLQVLDDRVRAKREVFQRYYDVLSPIEGIEFMPEAAYGISNRWLTVMTIDSEKTSIDRTQLIEILEKYNIESRPVWKPMHLQPLYRNYDYYTATPGISISDELFNNGICLPSGSDLSVTDRDRIISIIKKALKNV
ncbi:aminotransferase class I/II-fold pyridoxal phosphate-dependent enzyme [candidate division KSB1 bacterium]|nr:aminotransferase class I/II-fold pyridoxal phosphate-dependent enzyme [candidate division KSB1 bacterium]